MLLLLSFSDATGQAYIGYSKYAGGSGIEEVTEMQVINGETYLLGSTRSANFPVTNGSIFRGGLDITLTKYSNNGTVIYATYLGGLGNETVTSMKIINGEVYIAAYTDSINYPVTNGTVFRGKRDAVVTKLTTTGSIAFSTYLGGNGSDYPIFGALEISGNEVIIAGTTGSPGFPVTGNSLYKGGVSDGFVTKLNASDGSVISSQFFGGSNTDYVSSMLYENGSVYVVGSTFSPDLPVTIGSPVNDTAENGFITRLNTNNLAVIYARYLGGNKRDIITKSIVSDGMVHLTGFTGSTDYPVTNGTISSSQLNDNNDGFYTRLNPDGNIIYSTYLTTNDFDFPAQLLIADGDIYVGGTSVSTINGMKSLLIHKINANGSIGFTKRFKIGLNNNTVPSLEINNGALYVSGITTSPEYPVTNISQYVNGGTGFYTHLDATGNLVFSTFLGRMNALLPLKIAGNQIYLLGNTSVASFPVTDMSVPAGGNDNILVILKQDGTAAFSGYTGGSSNELSAAMSVYNNEVYFSGKTSSANYPVTGNDLYKANGDQYITKISFCPSNYHLANDTLSPGTQTACKFGLSQTITGNEITVPGDSLPAIYLNGIAVNQKPVKATYQWQRADSPSGPWTDITAATFKDYTPTAGAADLYFRRLVYTLPECGSSLIHISDTVVVQVNNLTAPVIDAGGPFNTCPGSAISIGGSPTVTGGNPPYLSYSWDMGATQEPNPTVVPNTSSIYTLIVTDNSGCRQIGQAVVLINRANAGADKGACDGAAVRIGTPVIPGIPGLLYNWQPGTGLNSSTIAQPLANPVTTTDYVLTLTLPKTGGGTCDTKDTVRVTPVAAPLTPDFAGPDKVFCLEGSATLGTAPEAGFNYVWSPGSYLSSNTFSTTTYYAGNIIMPTPNPAVMNLTAQKGGCAFSDQTIVATIEARAGLDGCGPRIIGLPDRTPDINETYSWTRISGPGNFTGPADLPQVPVSASAGAPTIYSLTVTYNGGSCTDQVTVVPTCSSCQTLIQVDAGYTCPSYDVNGGNVTLIAFSSIDNAVFTWTPQVGLSAYTGSVVQLTDNIPRVYTVTAVDVNDTTIRCSDNIFVNDPSFTKPVFPAPDTVTCVNQPISIGLPPVAGYSYEWTGAGLSGNLLSNPTAILAIQTAFPVKVSDGNGCELFDTVVVAVQNAQVNGGPDWLICSNGVVRLGTAPQVNTTYIWEPQSAPWQNGTTQFSAQPEVFIATDLTFTVTASTPAGCMTTDTVNVVVNANPTIANAPDKLICIGTSTMIGSPAIPGVTYQWTPAAGLNNPTIAQPLASPAVNTTYTVVATFPGSCASTASDQVTVTVSNPFFNIPNINFCPSNGPFNLGDLAPANMAAYSWSPAQLVTNAVIANPATLNPPPNKTTVFTLQVTNADGCRYRDSITIVPVIVPPVAGNDRLLCKNQSTNIGSAANTTGPGISYSWSPVDNLSDPTVANPVFTGTTGGTFTYILTKTDNNVSCSSKDTVIITVADIPLPLINNPTACTNSCVQIGTNPLPGIQYQWTPVAGLSNPNIANPLACVSSTTSYTLVASDLNGCTASANIIAGVYPIPAAQITIPAVTACLGDTNAQFNPVISPSGIYSYLWSPNDGTLSDITSLTPGITITGTGIKQYILQVTDTVTGCTNSATGNLLVNTCSPLATVGDFMWVDINLNGIQDSGESGVSGMAIQLFNSAGFLVAATVTDVNGYYYFTGIPPGNDYSIQFSKPAGYEFTTPQVGGVAANNNSKAGINGRSNNFNIPAGASILNMDAGIRATCPVPVTLLSFTGQLHNREVRLRWQTANEYNNAYFGIERSVTGINFTPIGRVNGHGTTSLTHHYTFTDLQPQTGVNFYRLRQVDFDGQSTYSHIVPIELTNSQIVSVYYDLHANHIRLLFTKPQKKTHLLLFGANGQLVRSATTPENATTYDFELPVLAAGVYIVQVVNETFTYAQKILINKKSW